jgi:hypothetical protein
MVLPYVVMYDNHHTHASKRVPGPCGDARRDRIRAPLGLFPACLMRANAEASSPEEPTGSGRSQRDSTASGIAGKVRYQVGKETDMAQNNDGGSTTPDPMFPLEVQISIPDGTQEDLDDLFEYLREHGFDVTKKRSESAE